MVTFRYPQSKSHGSTTDSAESFFVHAFVQKGKFMRKSTALCRSGVFLGVLLLLFQSTALADPPGRVGRLSYLSGTVSFFGDPDQGWQPARINYPVTSENSLWTDSSGRAETRVATTAVRIDGNSVLDFQRLDEDSTLLFLQRGRLSLTLRDFEKSDIYRISTPDGEVSLLARGRYRIDSERGESRITVFEGRAQLDTQGASLRLERGKTAVLRVTGNSPGIFFETVARGDFDDWVLTRDERWDSRQARYVSPYMTGYEDLDEHGEWGEVAEYGTVWFPARVASDWAPYRYGHWAWVRPWGWTWVDDAAWGFAPFHYGRWVHVHNRWGWWPGTYIGRPIYAPALVAWIGQPGWSVSYTVGSGPGIGWCPLAPYEPFLPAYTTNIVYIRNINHIHNHRPVELKPPSRYVNQKPGATVVSPVTFTASAPVATNRARVSGEAVALQPATQSASFLPPRGAGVSGSGVSAGIPKPPATVPGRMHSLSVPGAAGAEPAGSAFPKPFTPPPAITQGRGGEPVMPRPGAAPQPALLPGLAPQVPGGTTHLRPHDVTTFSRATGEPAQPAPPPKPLFIPVPQAPQSPGFGAAPPRHEGAPVQPRQTAPEIAIPHPKPGRIEGAPIAVDKPRPLAGESSARERSGEAAGKSKEGRMVAPVQ